MIKAIVVRGRKGGEGEYILMDSMGYTNTSGLKVGGSVWWSFYSIETDKTKAVPLFTVVSYLCKS